MSPYLSDADFTLYNCDVLEGLAQLEDESVHCVATSPPYFGLRDYGTGTWEGGDAECDHIGEPWRTASKINANCGTGEDVKNAERREFFKDVCGKCGARRIDNQLGLEPTPEAYIERMVEVFREVRRVLRKDGTCWLNIGDSYASGLGGGLQGKTGQRADRTFTAEGMGRPVPLGLKPKDLCMIPARLALALQADGWYLRSQIVWAKPNPMPESVSDRPTSAYEFVYLLTRSARYFYDAEAVREAGVYTAAQVAQQARAHKRRAEEGRTRGKDEEVADFGNRAVRSTNGTYGTGTRNLRNVWEISTEAFPDAHFATYPTELVRRCIAAGCPEDGVVFDPFMGSGTTALVARKLGRRCVGIELNSGYCELIAKRTAQLSLLGEEAV